MSKKKSVNPLSEKKGSKENKKVSESATGSDVFNDLSKLQILSGLKKIKDEEPNLEKEIGKTIKQKDNKIQELNFNTVESSQEFKKLLQSSNIESINNERTNELDNSLEGSLILAPRIPEREESKRKNYSENEYNEKYNENKYNEQTPDYSGKADSNKSENNQ